MIVRYYQRQPGGGYRLTEDDRFVEVYADYRYIWGRTAIMKDYDLPETVICKIADLKSIEEEHYEKTESH